MYTNTPTHTYYICTHVYMYLHILKIDIDNTQTHIRIVVATSPADLCWGVFWLRSPRHSFHVTHLTNHCNCARTIVRLTFSIKMLP